MDRFPSSPAYLDCNATTPIEPEVLEIVVRYMRDLYGNAGSRTHEYGVAAKRAVERARDQVAQVVAAQPDEVVFTSGGTESNNLALLGLAVFGERSNRRHILSTKIEHKAVLEPLEHLASRGFEVELLDPTPGGWVEAEAVQAALRPDTLLVSVMQVNNETGVRQPIGEIAALIADHPAFFHVDAAQGFGKELQPLRNPRVNLISVSGHKIYGPKGIGALVARRRGFDRLPLSPLMFGGGQERNLRPGTVAVPLIAGLGAAANLCVQDHELRKARCLAIRDEMLAAFAPLSPTFNGDPSRMLYNTLNLTFGDLDSEAVMLALKGVAALSNGSACTSHDYRPSHVLQAMALPEATISGALRLSWCHLTTPVNWTLITRRLDHLRPRQARHA